MKVVGYIACTIIGLFFLAYLLGDDVGTKMEVRKFDDGRIEITNVDDKPVTIKNIVANNRSDCQIMTMVFGIPIPNAGGGGMKPATLKSGDQINAATLCNVVKLALFTDSGKLEYEWKAR